MSTPGYPYPSARRATGPLRWGLIEAKRVALHKYPGLDCSVEETAAPRAWRESETAQGRTRLREPVHSTTGGLRIGAGRSCYDLDVGIVTTQQPDPLFSLMVMTDNKYNPLYIERRRRALETMFMHFLYFSELIEFFARGGRLGQAFPNLLYIESE